MTVCDQCGKPSETVLFIEVKRIHCPPQVSARLDLCHDCQKEATERVVWAAKPQLTLAWSLWKETDGRAVA